MGTLTRHLIRTTLAAASMAVCVGCATDPAAATGYQGTPDDFMQISQLLAKYSNDINTGDGDANATNFTVDAVWEDPSLCLIGRDAIADRLGGHHPGGVPGKDLVRYHQAELGPIVYIDKDHATVHSYVEIFAQATATTGNQIAVTGTYDDKLTRVNGKWKFAYRFVQRANKTPPIPCAPREANGFKFAQWP